MYYLNEKSFKIIVFYKLSQNEMKIAIIGPIHEVGWEVLRSHGFDVINVEQTDPSSLKKELADVTGVVLRTAKLPNDVLDTCPHLKIIARHGVGYDNVDLSYLNEKKIALGITSTANAISVAEHVLTFFLQLTKNIHLSDQLTRRGKFNEKEQLPDFFEVYQKNVLILGYGRIGQAVAKRCLGFEMNVYVYDPFVEEAFILNHGCKPIGKEEGLMLADYISVHLPLNDQTRNFIAKKELVTLKPNCILVNTARGGIINEIDLVEVLKNNSIAGAGLDVFAEEPPLDNHPLFQLPNILLTPHNAALSLECRMRMAKEACETVVFYIQNQSKLNLDNIVNRKILNL